MGVVGLAENKANSAQLELELGLSLATDNNKIIDNNKMIDNNNIKGNNNKIIDDNKLRLAVPNSGLDQA